MSTHDQELLSAFDGHDVDGVRAALDAGANPCSTIRGKLPVNWLLEEHSRSDRLGDCLRLLLSRGADNAGPCCLSQSCGCFPHHVGAPEYDNAKSLTNLVPPVAVAFPHCVSGLLHSIVLRH